MFFSLKLYLIIILIINNLTNIAECHIYTKDITHKKNIDQLNQIFDAHSQCLIQIQEQLSEHQKNIDVLRGNIQEIQYYILKITNEQKELKDILNKNCNDIYDINHIDKACNNINANHITHDNNINKITEETAYKQAVMLVLEKKQYDYAIQTFQNFIKNYPKSNYQSNAHYWLGQLFYNKKQTEDASYYFASVVKNYPNSSKAADSLLKIGIIMEEMKQYQKAQIVYQQVGKLYPNSNVAKQAQKRLIKILDF